MLVVAPDFDLSQPCGAIKIPPFQDMVMNKYWKVPFQAGDSGSEAFAFGTEPEGYTLASFAKRLRILDAYHPNNDQETMAFFIEGKDTSPRFNVLMLDDYMAEWRNSRITDLETYVRLACSSRFAVASRRRIFAAHRGDLQPLLKYEDFSEDELVPQLFKK